MDPTSRTTSEIAPSRGRWRSRIALLSLLALTALAYSSSLDGAFQLDDGTSVAENVAIRDLGLFLRRGLLEGHAGAARPFTTLTFAVNYAMGELDVRGFHLTNVLLHLAVVVVVFLFTRRTLRRLGWPAADGLDLWIAGLFALHPVQSQAVSYISQRAEVLASLFYLLAMLFLLEAEERGRTARGIVSYLAALIAFALGLGSKAIVVTLPAAYLLYPVFFPRSDPSSTAMPPSRRWATRMALAAPFLLASGIFAAVELTTFRAALGAGFDLPSLGPERYFLTQLRVLLTYLRLLVWPAGQNLDYAFPSSGGILEPRTLASGVLILALAIAAIVLWQRSTGGSFDFGHALARPTLRMSGSRGATRLASFGIVWFFVLLAPTSSVVPLSDVIEEHRVYLASWGILAALAPAVSVLFRRMAGTSPGAQQAKVALALGVLIALGVALYRRNEVWDSTLSMWRDVVAKSPTKARAHENLGHALYLAGDRRGAAEEYWTALRLGADGTVPWPKLLNNVGASLLEMGRLDEAIAFLTRALTVAPDDSRLLNNLAISYMRKGDLEAAAAHARRAVARFPNDPGAHNALGQILARKGQLQEAMRQFEIEATLNPDLALQVRTAATAQQRTGNVAQACGSWRRYLAMRPGDRNEAEARRQLASLECDR